MKNAMAYKKMKGSKAQSHPLKKMASGYSDNKLTPVRLTGAIVPWFKFNSGNLNSDFKLISPSGIEYFFVADGEWKGVLSRFKWEQVKVIGLLNVSNMTLVPQKVFPSDPNGETTNVIDLADWRERDFVKKLIERVKEFALVPVAVWSVMAS